MRERKSLSKASSPNINKIHKKVVKFYYSVKNAQIGRVRGKLEKKVLLDM